MDPSPAQSATPEEAPNQCHWILMVYHCGHYVLAISQVCVHCTAISITGNRPYQIRETTRITCSSVVGNVMIQWLRGSDVVAQMSGVLNLTLNITVDLNTNNTEYVCRVTVMDPPMFQESSPITIRVGGNF